MDSPFVLSNYIFNISLDSSRIKSFYLNLNEGIAVWYSYYEYNAEKNKDKLMYIAIKVIYAGSFLFSWGHL